jgi:hypothetical protein
VAGSSKLGKHFDFCKIKVISEQQQGSDDPCATGLLANADTEDNWESIHVITTIIILIVRDTRSDAGVVSTPNT